MHRIFSEQSHIWVAVVHNHQWIISFATQGWNVEEIAKKVD